MASDFGPHALFREMIGYSIDNALGTPVTVEVFNEAANAQGNEASTFLTGVSETVHVKAMSQDKIRMAEGIWQTEDLTVTAKYNTTITIESKITFGGNKYIVQSQDNPCIEGNTVFKRFFCKKQN